MQHSTPFCQAQHSLQMQIVAIRSSLDMFVEIHSYTFGVEYLRHPFILAANASGRILRSFYGSAFCPCDPPSLWPIGRGGCVGVGRRGARQLNREGGGGERGLINAIGKAKAADSTQAHPHSNPSHRSSGIFFTVMTPFRDAHY